MLDQKNLTKKTQITKGQAHTFCPAAGAGAAAGAACFGAGSDFGAAAAGSSFFLGSSAGASFLGSSSDFGAGIEEHARAGRKGRGDQVERTGMARKLVGPGREMMWVLQSTTRV